PRGSHPIATLLTPRRRRSPLPPETILNAPTAWQGHGAFSLCPSQCGSKGFRSLRCSSVYTLAQQLAKQSCLGLSLSVAGKTEFAGEGEPPRRTEVRRKLKLALLGLWRGSGCRSPFVAIRSRTRLSF